MPEAIAKTREFFGKNGRYPVDRTKSPAAYISIGYKGPSGASKRALAALLSYGLLEKAGTSGGESQVRVSERGFNIVALPDDDPDHQMSIMDAAMEPRIYFEMATEFSAGLPASDTILHSFLAKRGFHLDQIPQLIQDFRATMEYARIFDGGTISAQKAPDQAPATREAQNPVQVKPMAAQRVFQPIGESSQPIPIEPGRVFTLLYDGPMTKRDYDSMMDFLKYVEPRIVAAERSDPDPNPDE